MDTFEDVALAHKLAWDAGDYDHAAALLRRAKELVGEKGRVVQMGDGALQVVPNE